MANSDDPFSALHSPDHTIVRPVPGGRRHDLERQMKGSFVQDSEEIPLHNLGKVNPLESAASTLLALISRLYNSPSHDSPNQLKEILIKEVKKFNTNAQKAGYDSQTVNDAQYALCTTIDEAVINTMWGQEIGWSKQGLLSIFHDEITGGEQFFYKLKELGKTPSKHLDLLELKYICMALGFQGMYRIRESGRESLLKIRAWLAQLLRTQRGSHESTLSPHWQGLETQNKTLIKSTPIWVFFAIPGALLLAIFMGLLTALNAESTPVATTIAKLEAQQAPIPPKKNEIKDISERLLLERTKQYVDVRAQQRDGRTLVELLGHQGLFASGSDNIADRLKPVIKKIASILTSPEYTHHNIRVIGHTDNIPIKNPIRFANNFLLSRARANTVRSLLISYQPSLSDRTSIQGKGDAEPIDNNKTKKGRSINRRVEIILD